MRLFKKKNTSEKLTIECSLNSVKINKIEVSFPIHLNTLIDIFGEPSLQEHNIDWNVTWNDYGAYCDYGSWDNILSINFMIKETDKFKYLPKKLFTGKIFIDGINLTGLENDRHELKKYWVRKMRYKGEGKVYGYSIGINPNYTEEIPQDKYIIPKTKGKIIEFKDFNFKLAIIQELMYDKELLKPKFDIYEFVDWYKQRKINLEEEGHELIPEVIQYFKELPIPKSLAKEVVEIYQDGGNEIYLNLLRFGQGWEDYFDIENADDAKYFPNLKKAILCYTKENVICQLNEMGIEAGYL